MRIKNKEIRRRRHRKEQIIKAAEHALLAKFGDKKTATAAQPPKKAAPAKKASDAPKKAATPKAKKVEA